MIDYTKPVWTKSGKPVTILKIDLNAVQPVVGFYFEEDTELVDQWTTNGEYFFKPSKGSPMDLTNEPPKTLVD